MSISKLQNINTYIIDAYTKVLFDFNGFDGDAFFSAYQKQAQFSNHAQLDTDQKKFGISSLLLDGTDDYISLADSEDWNFGTGDFTIDFYLRFNATGQQTFLCQYENSTNHWYCYRGATGKLSFYARTTAGVVAQYTTTSAWSPSTNTWYHLAWVRNGSSFYMFIDGVSQTLTETVAISTTAMPNLTVNVDVGRLSASTPVYYTNGWIDELRISKGIARWTSNFSLPVVIDKLNNYEFSSLDQYTKLLIHFDGTDGDTTYLADIGPNLTWHTAILDDAEKKFGVTSMLCDGSGDYVTVENRDEWNFGTDDFTVDFWLKRNTIDSYQQVVGNTSFQLCRFNPDNKIDTYWNSDPLRTITTNTYSSTSEWYHIAIIRYNNTITFYVNGVADGSVDMTGVSVDLNEFGIGGLSDYGSQMFDGWIDEFRISKGIARWTTGFTPPTRAYGNNLSTINNVTV